MAVKTILFLFCRLKFITYICFRKSLMQRIIKAFSLILDYNFNIFDYNL